VASASMSSAAIDRMSGTCRLRGRPRPATGQIIRTNASRLSPLRGGTSTQIVAFEKSNRRRIVMPRELVEPHKGDKRYVRRGTKGKFTARQAKVGRSLSADRRSKAKTIVKKGEGDRGDRASE
jgi:hypothetical protein